uniref:Uncharacterized protein n=1 Tax=Trichogramma kaykai TaxID=54128 RepID=A0ABD2WD16_9HYME
MRSPKKKEEVRKELNCSLKRPVPTRWNSLFDSWKQLFDKWKLITSTEVQNIVSMLNEFDYSDYDHIREYLLWNEPLAKCIDKLQGEDNMYYGYVLPTLLNLRLKWKNLLQGNKLTITSKMVLREMMAHLETRFADFFEIENAGKEAALAALMHPKFKASWMYLLEETEQSKVLSLLRSLIRDEEEIVEEPEPMSQDDDDFFEFDPMEGQRLI